MSDGHAIVDPESVPADTFDTSEVTVHKLTEPLGCSDCRVNHVVLEPGDVSTPHTHEGQEEVFVAMTDAQIGIDGTVHDVSRGNVVRVRADVPRNLCNHTDERHVWLAVGAPPVGTVDDYGAYVIPGEES